MNVHLAVRVDGPFDVGSLVRLANTAERGLFDFLHVGGSAALTMSAALAGSTERLGLIATVDATDGRPFSAARQLATLDHLSDGRAGWYVPPSARAAEFVSVTRALWDSWEDGAVRANEQTGVNADPGRIHVVDHRGPHFGVRGFATLPAGPQGHPILLQEDGFGADIVVVPHSTLAAGRELGPNPGLLKVFSAITVADTAKQMAATMAAYVHSGACDGFLLVPPLTPDGLDEFVDTVIPILQERGVYRMEYEGGTLREHLGATL